MKVTRQPRVRCGLCRKTLRAGDSITAADVGDRCYSCFNAELADHLGIDFDDTPIAPMLVTDVDGVRHQLEIQSLLVATGHAMSAREVDGPSARGGYRFEILGDFEAKAHDLATLLRERIREGLSVQHVEETEHGWQLTQPRRLRGVIEWDSETDSALPLLIVDGRPFTWDQIGRMLIAFEGFSLNATVEDTIEVVGGPLAEARPESEASHGRAPAIPRRPTRAWPPSPKRLDALIEEATVDAHNESEQATGFLAMLGEHLALPFDATILGEAVVVARVDISGADELIAMCRRGGKRQKVCLVDLELLVPRPKGAEWLAAYVRWARHDRHSR